MPIPLTMAGFDGCRLLLTGRYGGQGAGGAAILNLARITSGLVGIPYELGGTVDGLDCFSLIAKYLKVHGIEIDSSFQGHKLSDYPDDYKANPKK